MHVSCFAFVDVEGGDGALFLWLGQFDRTKHALIFHNILLKGKQQSLGMFRGKDYS